ncbi:MAG TPA: lactate racemase domain-containing protein [Syntrophorhabdaceae bacterium]|nr:lactate racemase domain-containing protein [Syntrophorhabdaceae bacterium]
MRGQKYYLRVDKNEIIGFPVPARWQIEHFVEARTDRSVQSIEHMVRDALTHPTGTGPLSDVISGARSISVIVDDATRPTPVRQILRELLFYIEAAGFRKDKITIVIALGTHKAMDENALRERLGDDIATRLRIVQHNAWATDLVPVKLADEKNHLMINPAVAQADCTIGISSILPHPMAGYGGGPKIVMPGVANYDFIRNHHMTHLAHPGSTAGITRGNPFHEACMKAARAVGLTFSLNCIYDQNGQIVQIIGGSLESAYNKAVEACLEELGHRFLSRVDVTIASAFPHSHGHQFFKGLSAPDAVTKRSGAILLFVPMVTPLSKEFMESFRYIKEKSGNNPEVYIREHLSRGQAYLPDKSIDYNMAMSTPFLRPHIRVILVSPLISEEEARMMDFEYARSIEEGLTVLKADYPTATVAIFPSGGLIVPIAVGKP